MIYNGSHSFYFFLFPLLHIIYTVLGHTTALPLSFASGTTLAQYARTGVVAGGARELRLFTLWKAQFVTRALYNQIRMAHLSGLERATYVRDMFTRIAQRYDLTNRLITGGQDIRWRRQVIRLARLGKNARLLDLGTGTGNLAREALTRFPQAKVIAADFTLEMMRVGQTRGPLNFSSADALRLPFADASFDAVVSGFLMRNVIDLQNAIQEQHRVLKRGGRVVILDTTRPKKNVLSPLVWIHMHVVIPLLGRLLTGSSEAYRYLPETTEGFVTAENMAARMAAVGFKKINYERLMFGTIAIHWGEK